PADRGRAERTATVHRLGCVPRGTYLPGAVETLSPDPRAAKCGVEGKDVASGPRAVDARADRNRRSRVGNEGRVRGAPRPGGGRDRRPAARPAARSGISTRLARFAGRRAAR